MDMLMDQTQISKDMSTVNIDMSRYNNQASANQHVFGPNSPWTFIDCYWCIL